VALRARRDGGEVGHNISGGRGSIPHSGDRSDGTAPHNGDSTGAALCVVDPKCCAALRARAEEAGVGEAAACTREPYKWLQ